MIYKICKSTATNQRVVLDLPVVDLDSTIKLVERYQTKSAGTRNICCFFFLLGLSLLYEGNYNTQLDIFRSGKYYRSELN